MAPFYTCCFNEFQPKTPNRLTNTVSWMRALNLWPRFRSPTCVLLVTIPRVFKSRPLSLSARLWTCNTIWMIENVKNTIYRREQQARVTLDSFLCTVHLFYSLLYKLTWWSCFIKYNSSLLLLLLLKKIVTYKPLNGTKSHCNLLTVAWIWIFPV